MNSIQAATHVYRKKISRCIAVAQDIIAEEHRIRTVLDDYNSQIHKVKNNVLRINVLTSSQIDQSPILVSVLETSVRQLNHAFDAWRLSVMGRLGLAFDDIRLASDEISKLLFNGNHDAMSTIVQCHHDIENICALLIDRSIVDAATLKAIGMNSSY